MDQTPLINLPTPLRRLVEALPVGQDGAITSSELAARLGRGEDDPTNPQLRQAIRTLIGDHGWPVGSCNSGYYLIETNDELQSNLEELRARKRSIQDRIQDLRAAWSAEQSTENKNQGQLF